MSECECAFRYLGFNCQNQTFLLANYVYTYKGDDTGLVLFSILTCNSANFRKTHKGCLYCCSLSYIQTERFHMRKHQSINEHLWNVSRLSLYLPSELILLALAYQFSDLSLPIFLIVHHECVSINRQ